MRCKELLTEKISVCDDFVDVEASQVSQVIEPPAKRQIVY